MPKEYFKILTRAKIKQMQELQYDFVLLDVVPPEYYEEVHIQGAVNACVYEVNFIEQIEKITTDRNKTIVVCCNSSSSKAPDVAMNKLNKAGYTNVFIYREGTLDWQRSRNPVEGTKVLATPGPQLENRVYNMDPAESTVQWIGRNMTGAHYGSINIKSGSIPIVRRQPDKVTFLIDMGSIQNHDIQDPTWNRILVDHLKSEDFFDVEQFSTAKFDAMAFKAIEGVKAGGAPNYEVTGWLKIKGVSHEIKFPAIITMREDGALTAEAHFDIDRTLWNVNYGSGKLFEKLGKHLVHDFITIQLKLIAK